VAGYYRGELQIGTGGLNRRQIVDLTGYQPIRFTDPAWEHEIPRCRVLKKAGPGFQSGWLRIWVSHRARE